MLIFVTETETDNHNLNLSWEVTEVGGMFGDVDLHNKASCMCSGII